VPTLIFDEVDAGIGGRAAQAVAERMAYIAGARQVICVTHLPQIAAMADCHFLIQKRAEENRTRTSVAALDLEGRAAEIARMLGGAEITDLTLRHALEMIEQARLAAAAARGA
ncbi:MAG: DNA repair protein RecN, partial [Actinobacteria bacterium]|nr:DNA repair protein RecN [Actinomycetota bacterium]